MIYELNACTLISFSWYTTIASLYWHKNKLPSTSMVKMALAIFEEAKITNIEMKSHALLEIAPGIHSPVCPYLVEFSACVPPALHMGMTYDFHIGDLGFYKGSLSHFYQWSAWQLFCVSIQARNSSESIISSQNSLWKLLLLTNCWKVRFQIILYI